MAELRTTDRLDPKRGHDCDRMNIDGYRLREVVLPPELRDRERDTGIEIVIEGRNFHAMAQPLTAWVGDVPVNYLRIAPDERSIEGLLLDEPKEGSRVRVELGDVDAVQHRRGFDPGAVDRLG